MKKIIVCLWLLLLVSGITATKVLASSKYVVDEANLIDDTSQAVLEKKFQEISTKWNSDIALFHVLSTGEESAQEFADRVADTYYQDNNVVLLIVMDTRTIYISTEGTGTKAFTDYGIDQAVKLLASEYYSAGNYYEGALRFIRIVDEYYQAYQQGKPIDIYMVKEDYKPENPKVWLACFLAGGVISLLILLFNLYKLRSVHKAKNASSYILKDSFALTRSQDIFLYRTRRRMVIPKVNNNSGGSSIHQSSSGGFHGGGGGSF